VLSLRTSGNTGTWTGTGRWNGVGGYSFTASYGGNVVLRASAAHGDRVDKLVCLGWPMGAPVEHTPLSMRVASIPHLGAALFRLPVTEGMVRTILKQVGLRDAFTNGRISDAFDDACKSLLNDTDTMTNELRQGPSIITPVRGLNDSVLIPERRARQHRRADLLPVGTRVRWGIGFRGQRTTMLPPLSGRTPVLSTVVVPFVIVRAIASPFLPLVPLSTMGHERPDGRRVRRSAVLQRACRARRWR
jgi:pimeloyl-ACP methyl ester carboxylesterase